MKLTEKKGITGFQRKSNTMSKNKTQPTLHIRQVVLDDVRMLLDWRNDPLTRKQSRSSEEISWEMHLSYVTNVIEGRVPTRHLYLVENEEGTPVGTVRSDASDDGYIEISYTVAPGSRGKGIGSAMVMQFVEEFLDGKKIKAVIKKGSGPSEAIARALHLSPREEESAGGTDGIPLIVWRQDISMSIAIGARKIGYGEPSFIIAEISGNHHQKYEEAEQLVRAAKEAGADAVKLQTYTADTITLNSDKEYFRVSGKDQPDTWKGETLYNLYQTAYTPWEWQPRLKKVADEIGILLFSSPFDDTAVDFLEKEVGVDFYKIASYEAVHIPLLRKVASTRRPVIISVGFADKEEIALAIETLKNNGASNVVVLHCVTAYSDTPRLSDMNLATIDDIRVRFRVEAGFSDNNGGIVAPIIAAVVHKAVVVEKHLTLSRGLGGPDARFSLEPDELREMVARIRKGEREGIEAALEGIGTMVDVAETNGVVNYGPASPQEAENRIFRPSVWVKKDIKKGERLTLENIRVARPSHGLAPKFFDDILDTVATRDIEAATPFSWDLVST